MSYCSKPCPTSNQLRDTTSKICLTRQQCQQTTKCIPTTTIEWQKSCKKQMKTKCEQVPVPVDKCLTVKTTKCRKIKKKIPVEKVFYEKKVCKVPKVTKKACLVPCTKTITVPSTRVEYKECTEMVDKVEWVKRCVTEYECCSDYEEYDCEEKVSVPSWKLEDKQVKYCEEEISWEPKEVCNKKEVSVNKVCEKKIEACLPTKNLVCSTKVSCTCVAPLPNCFLANHSMVCTVCKKPRSLPKKSRSSSASSASTHHSAKSITYKPRKKCKNPNCKVCKRWYWKNAQSDRWIGVKNPNNYGVNVNFRPRNNSDGGFV